MKSYRMRRALASAALLAALGAALLAPTAALAQTAAGDNVRNLFGDWVKLSLMGYSQSEIESTLANVDPAALGRVKHRLRQNVVNNLRQMNLANDLATSSTMQDLDVIADKIRTEVRFAGLENDNAVRVMIRRDFGIALHQL